MRFRCVLIISLIILLSLMTVHTTFADSQVDKAISFYESGRRTLEGRNGGGGAERFLEEAKAQLREFVENKFTIEEASQKLKDGVPFVDFFNWLGQKAEEPADWKNLETIKSLYRQAAYKFQGSVEEFNKALALNPNYTDAYLKKAAACIELGHASEAINSYQKAKTLDFEGLSLPFSDVRHISYKIAQLRSQMGWDSEFSKDDPAVEVIKDLMSIRDKMFRTQLELTPDELEKQKIENQLELNRFELTNFFIQIGRSRAARDEYESQRTIIQPKLNRDQLFYSDAAAQIAALESDLRQSSVASFRIKLDPNLGQVSVRIMPTDIKLLIDRISLSFETEAPSFKLNDEIILMPIMPNSDKTPTMPTTPTLKDFERSFPMGEYLFLIELPRIDIRKKNQIPLELTLQKGMNYEENLIRDQAENSVKDVNVIKDRDLTIILKNIKAEGGERRAKLKESESFSTLELLELHGGKYRCEAGQIILDREIKEDEYEVEISFKMPHKFVIAGEEYKIAIRAIEPVESKVKSRLTTSSAILLALILSAVYR